MIYNQDFERWQKGDDDSEEAAVSALQFVKELETEAKKAREAAYQKLDKIDISKWISHTGSQKVEKVAPTLSYSVSPERLLLLKKENPDLFSSVAQSGTALSPEARKKLEEEKEALDEREAEISALLESDRLSREPELLNTTLAAQLLKANGIEVETKVTRKGSWKLIANKAKKADK